MATLTIANDTLWSKIYSSSASAFTIAIGGTAVLTVPAGQAYLAGQNLGLYPQGTALLTPLACNVASYNGTTLTLNVTAFGVLAGGTVGAVNTMTDRFAKQALSVTSNTIGLAMKTWAIRPGLNLMAGDGITTGDELNIVSRVSQANRMSGRVTAYNNVTGSVTINVMSSVGAGTFIDWLFTSGGSVSSWIVDVLDGDLVDVTGFATLTFDVSPHGCPNSYRAITQGKIKHVNTPEADPIVVRLAGKGTVDVRSNAVHEAKSATYKTVGTGTGAVLTVTLPPAWDKLAYPTAVEVETAAGSNVYEQWQVYPSYIYGVQRYGYHYGCDLLDVFQGNLGGTNTGAVANTAYAVTGGSGTGGEFFVQSVSGGNITAGYFTKGIGYSVGNVLTIQAGNNVKTFTVTVLGTFGGGGPLNKVVIWNPAARALNFGDNTNGVAVPNGSKVRIPNCALEGLPQEAPIILDLTNVSTTATFESAAAITIFDNSQMFINSEAIMSSAKTNNLFTLTRGGTNGRGSMVTAHTAGSVARNHNLGSVTNKCQVLTDPGGTLDYDGFILGENITVQSANSKGVTFKRFGTTGQMMIRNTPAAVTWDGYSHAGNPYADCIAGGPISYLNTVQGIINANNVTIGQATWNTNIGQGNVLFQPLNCPQIESMANFRVAAVKLRRYDINTVTLNGCLFLSDGALHDFDVTVRSLFQTLSGTRFYNIRHCSHVAKFLLTDNSQAERGLFCLNVSDCLFHGLGSVVGCQPTYMNPLTLDGGSNSNLVHSSAYEGSWLGSPSLFHLFDNRGVNNSFVNISSTAIRDSTYYNYSNGGSQFGTTERRNNIRLGTAFVGGSQWPSSESQDDFVVGTSVSATVPNLQDAAWWHNLIDGGTLTPTTGRVFLGYGGPNVNKTNYTITGSVRTFVNNSGSMFLGDTGDTVTFSNWYPLRGITSFQNSTIVTAHNNWTGVTEQIRFCPWGQDIAAVGFVTMDITNVLTMFAAMTGYSSDSGLQIQIRYTATTTATNRNTTNVYLLTNVNPAFLPPVGYVPITTSAIVAGSSFVATFAAVQYGLDLAASATEIAYLPYGFSGSTETAAVTVTKLGYLPFLQGTSFGRRGSSVVAVQVVDGSVTVTNAATVAAYTTLETVAKLYDYTRYYETTAAGIAKAGTLVSASGTSVNFGSINLTLNAGAASVFTYVGNTITAKVSAIAPSALSTILTIGTVTASLTSGGAYTYTNGALTTPTTAPILTGGRIDLGASATYGFATNTGTTIVSMTPTAPSTYTMNGPHAATLDLRNTSTNAITVQLPTGTAYTTANNTGGVITVALPATTLQFLRPNIINGSNFVIRNVTQANEASSGTVSGGTGINVTLTSGAQYNAADVLELKIGYCVGTSARLVITDQATAPAITAVNSAPTTQVVNDVYASLAINGSSRTEFSADYVNNEVDIVLAADFYGQNFMAWWVYNESTLNGLRKFVGLYTLIDEGNIRNNTTVGIALFDNATTSNIKQIDNARIFRSDGGYPVKQPSSGGGAIDINWRNSVQTVVVGGGGGSGGATLAEIEASAVIAKQTTVAQTLAAVQALPVSPTTAQIWSNPDRTLTSSIAPTAAQIASQVRTELSTELSRVDVATSTRLATSGYTAPNNTGITNTLAAVQALPAAPTSAQNSSAVLATLNANTIPVSVQKIKGQDIRGIGTAQDPWGPV